MSPVQNKQTLVPEGPPLDDSALKLRDFIINPDVDILTLPTDYIPIIFDFDECPYGRTACPDTTTIIAERDEDTGAIIGFKEVDIEGSGCDARTSMSLKRAPGPPEEATRGNAMNYPFWPGGFDPVDDFIDILDDFKVDFEKDLLSIAPGFSEGLDFTSEFIASGAPSDVEKLETEKPLLQTLDTVDILALVQRQEHMLDIWKDSSPTKPSVLNPATSKASTGDLETSVLQLVNETPVLKISEAMASAEKTKTDWAEMIDVSQPVHDFDQIIPDPAHTYPFELDTFQKQAIIKLEEHNHVFVAAHTSAGKTVVAEYAIALSRKHMTRAIYTSPIKALSNQKYRDFSRMFKEVGLITGDIQINPTASCLIMTTEILKSMLYCGSEVTRDLEYVIFDEVHYINDADRGHVWEEVLILLPNHVTIVMLSATVPNTMEFANWVGLTKRRKVYVISTPRRPVPLQHYLYTGCGGKSKDERFLVVDEKGQWVPDGYAAAVAAKLSRQTVYKKEFGPRMTPKQEQTMWIGLLNHLERSDLLPVVAFTLSRNRCDKNAEALLSVDLIDARQKSRVHMIYGRCLKHLKAPDREIPQVKRLQALLERGIGVHHSGILPILKEIVEMCFAEGLVKLLFATETFAMGVNMPARTVVFDSSSKYDGVEDRTLHPAEYIQMAGRAGRRGKDPTGTVILLCKKEMREDKDDGWTMQMKNVKEMMLGKPMKLQSQFRLTYAMILNLIRVQSVSVESMMSHSFREFGEQIKAGGLKEELKAAEDEMSTQDSLGDHLNDMCSFYNVASRYILLLNEVMPELMRQSSALKLMTPGRVLIVSQGNHYNKLAILLEVKKDFTYRVLVLCDQLESKTDDIQLSVKPSSSTVKPSPVVELSDTWHRMLSLSAHRGLYVPQGSGGHEVILIHPRHIAEITTLKIKVDADLVLKDWDKRQIPRFKNDPPGKTCSNAISELIQLTNSVSSETTTLEFANLRQDLMIKTIYLLKYLEEIDKLKPLLETHRSCLDVANFEEQFLLVFNRNVLEGRKQDLSYRLSYQSMSLYPDYQNMMKVLKQMRYIDVHDKVLIKGRVACQMGGNELIITEIVFRNTLKDLTPAEIAALLSALVFQAKTTITPTLTETLKEGIKAIKSIDADLAKIEESCNIGRDDVSVATDKLNFGLVQVVYEWAQEKPFSEIVKLTDVQEGIIVRCIQQLSETIRDVKDAAQIIGDPVLSSKMDQATIAIKRDIVFAASLYTQDDCK